MVFMITTWHKLIMELLLNT